MTRFKEALLEELVAHAQQPGPTRAPAVARRRRATLVLAPAGIAAAAVVLASSIALPGKRADAYAVDKHPDGTVSITFRELADPQAATRDLRKAGVRAKVIRLGEPGSCPGYRAPDRPRWTPPPGFTPVPSLGIRVPSNYPIDDATVRAAIVTMNGYRIVIRPSAIPAGAVVLILQPPSEGTVANLVPAPAPACWEYEIPPGSWWHTHPPTPRPGR